MATPRLFRLKSQVAPAASGPVATELPFARIWVDTGVFHLDTPYDYEVPEKFSDLVTTGIRVQVPFGSREVEGLVIERIAAPSVTNALKSITKLIHPLEPLSPMNRHLTKLLSLHVRQVEKEQY